MYVFLVNIVGIWCAVMLHLHEYYFYSDHEAPGRPVCFWSSSALLSVACKVDRTAAACRATAQSAAARSKGTLQFRLHPTSFTATTTNTSRYAYIHYSSMHISQLSCMLTVNTARSAQPAGPKISSSFPRLFVSMYICASALITCTIITSCTLLPCDLAIVDFSNLDSCFV